MTLKRWRVLFTNNKSYITHLDIKDVGDMRDNCILFREIEVNNGHILLYAAHSMPFVFENAVGVLRDYVNIYNVKKRTEGIPENAGTGVDFYSCEISVEDRVKLFLVSDN